MGVFRFRFGCFSFGFYRRLTGLTVGPGSQASIRGTGGRRGTGGWPSLVPTSASASTAGACAI